jgi:hypothetical protein
VTNPDGSESLGAQAYELPVAPANIGPRSTPNYEEALGKPSVATLSNGDKVFAGPRKDAFFADLGSVFDLLGLRPLNGAHKIPLPTAAGVNGLSTKNVHSIAIQVPIASVTKNGTNPTVVDDKASVIGIFSTTSRREVRVLNNATETGSGNWVQVSRIGLPLVNETLIPLGLKDKFNATQPRDDVANSTACPCLPIPEHRTFSRSFRERAPVLALPTIFRLWICCGSTLPCRPTRHRAAWASLMGIAKGSRMGAV